MKIEEGNEKKKGEGAKLFWKYFAKLASQGRATPGWPSGSLLVRTKIASQHLTGHLPLHVTRHINGEAHGEPMAG
jgi:hypothetical protein